VPATGETKLKVGGQAMSIYVDVRPSARRVAMLGVGARGGRNFFFEIFDAKSRVWGAIWARK